MSKLNPIKKINNMILNLEQKGWVKRTPGFIHDYEKTYPYFKELEANHAIIEKECRNLLAIKENIPDTRTLGGKDTKGTIHDIKWKSFMFKSGTFIKENCELCPETTRLLKKIPRVKQVFFSILDPNQHIKPHKGYYRGFLRYHLGVIIPNNNEDKKCWIRINDDFETNEANDRTKMAEGETYYWKNGEGIMFNDIYLHEAANETDEVRIVLFIDVMRKFPLVFDLINKFLMFLAYFNKDVRAVAKNARLQQKPMYQ